MKVIYHGIFFGIFTFFIGCGSSPQPHDKDDCVDANSTPKLASVNITLDNSLSMMGYLNGNTEFKNTVTFFLNKVFDLANSQKAEINCYTTDDKHNNKDSFQKFSGDADAFRNAISNSSIMTGTSSYIHTVLDSLNRITTNNSVSVFITDGILSVDGDNINQLSTLQAIIHSVFSKNDNEASIYQFTTSFDGTYYDLGNGHEHYVGKRPYYVIIVGKSNVLKMFRNDVMSYCTNSEKGYNHEFHTGIFEGCVENGIYRFALSGHARINPEKKHIDASDFGFTTLVGFNVEGMPNYIISENVWEIGGNYKDNTVSYISEKNLEASIKIPAKQQEDFSKFRNKYKHFLKLTLNKNVGSKIDISLKNQLKSKNVALPKWVNEAHSLNDQNTNDSLFSMQTFGLKNLIEGIATGRQASEKDNIITITLNLN